MGGTLNVPACQLREPLTPANSQVFASPARKYSITRIEDDEQTQMPPTMRPPEPPTGADLCAAAHKNDLRQLKALLAAKANPSAMDYDRRAPLHIAAAEGYLPIVEFLLEAGADPKPKDRWGHTPLDEATNGGFPEVQVALRLAGGEDSSTPKREPDDMFEAVTGDLPVAAVLTEVAGGNLAAVKKLCSGSAQANAADYDGRTPLHIAAAYGHKDILNWLIQNGADVNAHDHFGHSALSEAEEHGHTDICAILKQKGATQAMDRTALRLNSELEYWAIKAEEVVIGDVLSKTIKSVIYTANWRGTRVVIKTIAAKSQSTNALNLMAAAHAEDQSSGTDSETFRLLESEMLHEIRLLSHMRHPDLVMFLGACLDHSPPFLMTEFMEGGDLERFYMKESAKTGHPYRPPWVRFMKWASSVARALSFLHNSAHPIIHRDLKPLNLLLTANQDLKVTDFGISKLMPKQRHTTHEIQFMSGGVGTWRYMAPEVVRCEEYTDRVDVYSYALILWFMATGLQPFASEFGKDPELVLKAYLRGEEPRPAMNCSGTKGLRKTPELKALIEECWHVQASKRPSSNDCTQRLAAIRESYGSRSGIFQRGWSGF